MIRGRFRGGHEDGEPSRKGGDYIEIDPRELTRIFAAPPWLRDVGLTAWLLVGVALFLAGMVWLLSLTQVIVLPVLAAGIVAAVASPLVAWLHGHGVPRGLGAALLMVAIILIGIGMMLVVVGGITGESSSVGFNLSDAQDTIAGWLKDLGVDPSSVQDAKEQVSSAISDGVPALLRGVVGGLSALSSSVFFLAMTALSLFFLLKDGPSIRAWTDRHMGVPLPVAQIISQRVLGSLRGYFLGVTIVAVFNAAVVALGAWVLAVPLIGTIAGGAMFGTIGLILAEPLTSAVVRISADLARARAEAEPSPSEPSPSEPGPQVGGPAVSPVAMELLACSRARPPRI